MYYLVISIEGTSVVAPSIGFGECLIANVSSFTSAGSAIAGTAYSIIFRLKIYLNHSFFGIKQIKLKKWYKC